MRTPPDRKQALLSLTAGTIFLLVAIFDRGWNWRGALAFTAGVIWIILGVQQFIKAR